MTRPHASILALFAAPALLLAPAVAHAVQCSTDADCAKGMTCDVTGGTACAVSSCPAGQTCPPSPPCEPQVIKECVPGPCHADSDCAAGLVCVTNTFSVCSMPACASGTTCTPTCVDQSESRCAPPYVGPCTVDADCGDGFSCVSAQSCGCAAGGGVSTPGGAGGATSGTGTSSAGASSTGTAGAPSDCTCTNTGGRYCQPNTFSCTTTQDCPAGWTCDANPTIAACPGSVDGGTVDCPVQSGVAAMICTPPYWVGATSAGYAKDAPALGSQPAEAYLPNAAGTTESKDSGGCQLSPGGEESGIGTLFGLGALAFLFSRRRSARG